MHLYHLTLHKAGGISHVINGSFSAPRTHELVIVRGAKILELVRVDKLSDDKSVLSRMVTTELFGTVRAIAPFRLPGAPTDYVVIGSDSGAIVVLEFSAQKNAFQRVHHEIFGKTGCRRIVPGQYLAVDPKGRALIIGAIEKQKFVYVLNRDAQNRLTISSPLEAHKSHTVCYSLVSVDVGFENPVFASLEVDHSEIDQDSMGQTAVQKNLVYYELDLGLNTVMRKWLTAVDRNANFLISVPGTPDGPSGVLVCSENFITYKKPDHPDVRVAIPRRFDMHPERGLLIVAATQHKQKEMFFFLVQSELGDLYKLTLEHKQDTVSAIKIKYFDTVPVASSISLLRSGFLFVASEFANHKLFKFESIGDDEEDLVIGYQKGASEEDNLPLFRPRALSNLSLQDELNSLSPITELRVMDHLREGTPQLFALCGRGVTGSALRVLRHGLAISNLASSPLPGNANAVWTVKMNKQDAHHRYIVISFASPGQGSTLVLLIGKQSVESYYESGLLDTTQTLSVSQFGDDAILQIYPQGIRYIKSDMTIVEWKTPGKKAITRATANERQVVVALSGGEIIYFELNEMGQLAEVDKKEMGMEVACIDIGPVPAGRQRSRFLAIGFYDKTVRILSLEADSLLAVVARQALSVEPTSLAFADMHATGQHLTEGSVTAAATTLYLNIGLHSGVLQRSVVDSVTGELSDTRTRFLGTRPVRLLRIQVQGSNAVLALSSRSWLMYNYQSQFKTMPLSTDPFDTASNFSSEYCPDGVVAVSLNLLRILTFDKLGDDFNQQTVALQHTPRRFIVHPGTRNLIIIETEHNAYPESQKQEMQKRDLQQLQQQQQDSMDVDGSTNQQQLPERDFGERKPQPNSAKWASYIRIFDVDKRQTLEMLELEDNEAATSLAIVNFHEYGGEPFLVVGTSKDLQLLPQRKCVGGGVLRTYRFINDGKQLEIIHKTPVEEVPYAMLSFQGRLLVGIGNTLRIYDMGKKRLLRKCENKNFPNMITSIHAQGDRIYVGDIADSLHFVAYRRQENGMYIFADDTTPRWTTAATLLDYDTVAGADKFGNFFVLRLPEDLANTTEEGAVSIEDEGIGGTLSGTNPNVNYSGGIASRWIWDRGYLNGAPHKLRPLSQFHVGDTITSLQRCSLMPGGAEVTIYSTVMGAIGIFIPLANRAEVDFFSLLEMHMRQENPPLCGSEHIRYRSYYFPVKDVVDGDLCEQFALLDSAKQRSIAGELSRTASEVLKKLEDVRNRIT